MKDWLSKNILFVPLFPVVFLLFNANEYYYSISIREAFTVLGITSIFTALLWGMLYLAYKNKLKAALAAFAIVVVLGYISYILYFFKQYAYIVPFFKARFILPVLYAFVALFLVLIYKRNSSLRTVCLYLNLLVLFNLFTEIGRAWNIKKAERMQVNAPPKIHPTQKYPDVYFILSDAYTSIEMLKKHHHGDNAAFVSFLDSLGFHIVPNARSSYKFTFRTLGSIWNMDYLPDSLDDTPENSAKNALLENLMIKNASTQWFQNHGYICYNITSYPFYGQPSSSVYDTHFTFLNDLIAKTLIPSGLGGWIDLWYTMPKERERHQRIIQETIASAAKPSDAPKLVYCHIYMPHDPYVFLPTGEINRWSNPYNPSPQKYYDQVLYTNTLLTKLLKGLMELPGDPIVVLTGDHGYRQFMHEPEKTESDYGALTAFYFPSRAYSQIHEGLTSPNIMRLIINQLEPGSFPLVKDTSNFYY